MIVCSCNVLSDGQVRDCLQPGPGCPRTAAQVYQCLGCSPKCGRCARTIRKIMADALAIVEAPHACATSCAAACPLSHGLAHAAEHRLDVLEAEAALVAERPGSPVAAQA